MAGNWWDGSFFGDYFDKEVGGSGGQSLGDMVSMLPGFSAIGTVQKATGNFGEDNVDAITAAGDAQGVRTQEELDRYKMDRYKDQKANAPFAAAGRDALAQQRALAGLDGEEAQAAAIAELEQSPQFQAYLQQQEGAILANAAATGGLRGGNVQGALAQGRSQLLSDVINQQYSRLGSLVQGGQQATQFGIQAGQNNAGLFGAAKAQQGANEAGAILGSQGARDASRRELNNFITDVGGTVIGAGAKAATGGVL